MVGIILSHSIWPPFTRVPYGKGWAVSRNNAALDTYFSLTITRVLLVRAYYGLDNDLRGIRSGKLRNADNNVSWTILNGKRLINFDTSKVLKSLRVFQE